MKNTENIFFITGTGTDVGKTYVSRLLSDTFAVNSPVTYIKPVQSGCFQDNNGHLHPTDYEYVMKGNAKPVLDENTHVTYRFKTPCSPHLAAQENKKSISQDKIIGNIESITRQHHGITLIEGAGGLMVPLSKNIMMIDLIKNIGVPVILVTSPKLGTLNHTFLSLSALNNHKIKLAGVVFNSCKPFTKDYIYKDNLKTISKYINPVPLLETFYNAVCNYDSKMFCNKILGQRK